MSLCNHIAKNGLLHSRTPPHCAWNEYTSGLRIRVWRHPDLECGSWNTLAEWPCSVCCYHRQFCRFLHHRVLKSLWMSVNFSKAVSSSSGGAKQNSDWEGPATGRSWWDRIFFQHRAVEWLLKCSSSPVIRGCEGILLLSSALLIGGSEYAQSHMS